MSGRSLRFAGSLVISITLAACVSGPVRGRQNMMGSDEPTIRDSFTGGKPELEWLPYPHFNMDNLRGSIDETSPEGEPGIGILDNKNAGGFAALSYATSAVPSDFYLETWMHAQVSRGDKGPLNGVAFRIDIDGGDFYRLATDFTVEPTLSLAFVGKATNNFPDYLGVWKAAAIPGGAPQTSGWHKLAIAVQDDKAEVYWNGVKLPGGPFLVDRVRSGFIGVYANFVGGLGLAETKIDALRVWRRN
ncbi:MAG: hypothetical protein ACREQV_22645 [Candidatus Binatia bacterium]